MRRDNASNYLRGLIDAAWRLKGRWPLKPGAWIPLDLIGDRDLRRLSPDTSLEGNAALRAAFEAFDLDPSEPENWRLLLALFAEAHFGLRGRTLRWDGWRLCQLLADFAVVKKEKGNLPDRKICEHVKTAFPKRYRGVTAVTIRRKLQDARNSDKNEILGRVLRELPPGSAVEYVIELISEQWKSG